MDTIRNRIKAILDAVGALRYTERQPMDNVQIAKGDYTFSETFSSSGKCWKPFGRSETWGELDGHFYFLANVSIPNSMAGQHVRALVSTAATDIWNTDNPQMMAYVNGKFAATLDMNHAFVDLADAAKGGEEIELAFYAYSSSFTGNFTGTNFFHLDLAVYRDEAVRLYYDMKPIFEAADLLGEDDLARIEAFKALNACVNCLDLRKPGSEECFLSMERAAAYLEKHYYEARTPHPVTVHSIGHTHIDVAWKWPLRQTRQKAVRSFETVLNLMDRYPEYKFMSSQPQLYEFVREEAPGVFARIKERIKEGRWEAEGAMWLEPDCNLSSGESLIRHILYGRNYFEKTLGAPKNEVLWLPDVFGYSAAMPQILRKSGIPYFMTTKIGWNEFNCFPHDTFRWKGIDGSEVLTHLISTRDYRKPGDTRLAGNHSTTYNGMQNATQLMGTWQRYQDKDVSTDVLTCFGYGDGGGGPTEEMLEESRRLEKSVANCPVARQTHVKDFFHILEENMDRSRLATWDGELYLEYHRGTYTSIAKNKKYNRKAEFANGEAEMTSVLAGLLDSERTYPKEELERNWKLVLLNQFHDILPGSSIKEVYDDSWEQYETVLASDERLIGEARAAILEKLGCTPTSPAGEEGSYLAVWNPTSFARKGLAQTEDGAWHLVTAAPSGVTLVDLFAGDGLSENIFREIETNEKGNVRRVKTPFYTVEFDENAEIQSLVDLRESRELVAPGKRANELRVYEDRPMEYDAWNLDEGYMEHSWRVENLSEFAVLENGLHRASLIAKRKFGDSSISQIIRFYAHTARIDFVTRVDWREHQQILRTAFPLDILAHEADFEIQFGNVRRPTHKNTSWDKARFEVCAHKWADLSEPGYGAALLNDCKYGYDVHDGVLSLSLIKSGIFPNPQADQGIHEFTYALFPHQGDFRAGGVIREAYDLNCPLSWEKVRAGGERSLSLVTLSEENVMADTVKRAESGEGIIIRLYEAWGKRTKVHLRLPAIEGAQLFECDCMEEVIGKEGVTCEDGAFVFAMKPYEIKTFLIRRN